VSALYLPLRGERFEAPDESAEQSDEAAAEFTQRRLGAVLGGAA
jgi:hypothetical protein